MTDAILVIVGVVVGAVIVSAIILIAMSKRQPEKYGMSEEQERELRDSSARAMSLENALSNCREQLQRKEDELSQEREKFAREAEKRTAAETREQEAHKNLEQQKELLKQATERLSDVFKGLSSDALRSNNRAFLELAGESFKKLNEEMKGELAQKQESISGIVKPLSEMLKNYEGHLKSIENTRQQAYTSLEEHLKTLTQSNSQLRQETDNLVRALRKPHVRGKWGEFTLKRTAELAGMVDRCDFQEQFSISGDTVVRPDMVVNLPGGRTIVVDSKAPLDAYLDFIETEDETLRAAHLARHARQIKEHMRSLSVKSYWSHFDNTPEFVVMFLPGESFLSAALESDRELIEEGFKKKVILATPTTLVALLKAVAFGWQQEQMADQARTISELGKDLYKRISSFVGHLDKMRGGLKRAVDSYNGAVGSMERMVLPAVRRFKELNVTSDKDIEPMEQLETEARIAQLPEDMNGLAPEDEVPEDEVQMDEFLDIEDEI